MSGTTSDQGENQGARPAGPAIEKQLADAKVIPGSALERLIRNNQDFQMLRADEFDDKLPFPLWLRVHYRKMHPELNFADPKLGYPLILKEMYFWMIRHQDLPTQ
jgi:hypothetical protein